MRLSPALALLLAEDARDFVGASGGRPRDHRETERPPVRALPAAPARVRGGIAAHPSPRRRGAGVRSPRLPPAHTPPEYRRAATAPAADQADRRPPREAGAALAHSCDAPRHVASRWVGL